MCYLCPRKSSRAKMSSIRQGKKARKAFIPVLVCLSLSMIRPLPVLGQEQGTAGKSLGSLEKSLLIPGWGQLSEKRYIEGVLFLAAEAFCLYGIFLNDHAGNRNYSLYKKAETMDDAVRFRQLAEKFDARRNRFLLAAAAVWAVNLVDITLIVKSKTQRDKSFSLRIQGGQHQILSITARCRF